MKSSVGRGLDVTGRKTSSFGRSRDHCPVGCHPNTAGRATQELTLSICELFTEGNVNTGLGAALARQGEETPVPTGWYC